MRRTVKSRETFRRELLRFCALACLCLLPGCLSDIRDQLDQCTSEARASYPEDKSMPMGQPYKDILACMQKSGYTLVQDSNHCKVLDYTTTVGDPYCYRPSGTFKGYLHDVTTTLR